MPSLALAHSIRFNLLVQIERERIKKERERQKKKVLEKNIKSYYKKIEFSY